MARHARVLNRAAEAGTLLLSSISVYETALIGIETDRGGRRGRQAVKMRPTVNEWIRDALVGTRVVVVALDADVAMNGAALHAMHADPFDRLIVAAATSARARLVTADSKILAFARDAGLPLLEL
jgi:PIN domain nuclease of toxin-antitoxin system